MESKKGTYKRDNRPTKETIEIQKSATKRTIEKDLQKRPTKQTNKREQQKEF